MEFRIDSVKFVPHHPAFENFQNSRTGPVGQDLYKRGLRLQMLAKASAPHRSYALRRSITLRYERTPTGPLVRITANVPYAYYIHEGTRPHMIRPNRSRVLRFVVAGKVVYAQHASHPGNRADPFLARHLRTVVR